MFGFSKSSMITPDKALPGHATRPFTVGDTHAVHVSLDEQGGARLDALVKGDTVREVLDYVEFDAEVLLGKLRTDVESAVRAGRIDYEGAGNLLRFYEDGLHGYTYLEG